VSGMVTMMSRSRASTWRLPALIDAASFPSRSEIELPLHEPQHSTSSRQSHQYASR
jgi:hypothetical protein